MRKLILTTACFMACIMVWAAPVSRTQALQTAKTFMKQKGWAVSQQPRLAPRGAASQAAQNDYIYVFNSSNGFVVISGDDQTEPVLAYAEGGQFDETQIPANMKWWLGEYERQIRYIQENGLTVNTFVLNKPAISPMLSTDWSQDAPYSNKCPEVNGKACATGCLATAMAQVMNYHKWPQDATTSIPGYTTYSNKIKMEQLPATTFDWANMRSNYRYNSGTDAQKDAVAELMLYCGQATQMDYDPNGSGASEMYLANAFVNYFGYDESAQTLYRETYITPDWEEMVYNELANDRPVLYCGQSTGGGHAFVCDGYDGNGLYHIAWGWGWNSYFTSYCRLSILNPNTTTQTGASTTEDGFTFGQSATIGVRRPGVGGNTVPLTILLDMDYTQVQGTTVHLCVGSMLAKTYSFNIALAILSDNGDKTIISQNTLSLTPMYQTWQYDRSSHSLSTSLFPGNGTYKIVPICRKNGTTEWSYMSDPTLDYLTATVNGSSLTIGKNYHTDSNISVTDMQFTGDIKTTADCELVVDVTNSGTAEFNTELYCFQSTTTSKGSAVSVAGAYVMPGETEQVYFYFKPKAKENLTVWICTDEKGNNVIGQKTFAATPKDEYMLELTDNEVTIDPLQIKISVKNNSTIDYDRAFRLTIYRADTGVSLTRKYTKTQTIAAGETGVLEFKSISLDTSHDYYAILSYYGDTKTTDYSEFDTRIPIVFSQPDGIRSIENGELRMENYDYYNLSGQRVGSDYKGIVIRNGKKIIR